MRSCKTLLAIMLVLPFASHVRADDYYLVLFAYEGGKVTDTHTFAAFAKVDAKPALSAATVHTISWLPASLDVKLLKRPEGGVNMSLEQTLKLAATRNLSVTAWGPYHVKKEVYDRALDRIEKLNSGKIAYKALDRKLRAEDAAVNCIHAVSDLREGPMLDTGTAAGNAATVMVRDHFKSLFLDDGKRHPNVIDTFGLKGTKITFAE